MRVTSTINEFRREMDQYLRADLHNGRFQSIENALNDLSTSMVQQRIKEEDDKKMMQLRMLSMTFPHSVHCCSMGQAALIGPPKWGPTIRHQLSRRHTLEHLQVG